MGGGNEVLVENEKQKVALEVENSQPGDKIDVTNLNKNMSDKEYQQFIKDERNSAHAKGNEIQIESTEGKTYLNVFKKS